MIFIDLLGLIHSLLLLYPPYLRRKVIWIRSVWISSKVYSCWRYSMICSLRKLPSYVIFNDWGSNFTRNIFSFSSKILIYIPFHRVINRSCRRFFRGRKNVLEHILKFLWKEFRCFFKVNCIIFFPPVPSCKASLQARISIDKVENNYSTSYLKV